MAIKSLPQEWLWCQTWCSDDKFPTAKVIDLCNNPLTKEAKLTAAQRIVPEWKDYDTEIKKLMIDVEDREMGLDEHEQTTTSTVEKKKVDEKKGKCTCFGSWLIRGMKVSQDETLFPIDS